MRLLMLLLLLSGPALAQDEDDDEESAIEIEKPPEAEAEAEAEADAPAGKSGKPGTQPAGKGEWVRVRQEGSPLSIELLDTWRVRGVKVDKDGWECTLELPGPEGGAVPLRVRLLPGRQDPRGLPAALVGTDEQDDSISDSRIGSKLLPHAIYTRLDGEQTELQAYRSYRGHVIDCAFAVASPMSDAVYESLLKAAATAEADLSPFPDVPADYKSSTKRGLRYAVHPSVSGSIKPFQTVTQGLHKSFEKFHGKLPAIPRGSAPPTIYIHSTSDQALGVAPELSGEMRTFRSDQTSLRFFGIPVAEGDPAGAHDLAASFGHFLVVRKYGPAIPRWVAVGELNVAAVEQDTGKPLPWIVPGMTGWMSGLQLPKLDSYTPGNEETVPRICFFYVAFFRAGGTKYKKAYRAFLEDIATQYDPAAAARRHLEPLGYDKLQAAATRFMLDGFKVAKG